jgi:type I restriction enzyme M protein
MLTDPKLKSQVDKLWDMLWTGGLTNPMDAIEQLSFLIFLKRLDDEENRREAQARRRGQPYEPRLPADMRWGTWTKYQAADALKHVRDVLFPALREMGTEGSSYRRYMATAEFKINKPSLLINACNVIDQIGLSGQQQDVQGDLYEYLLSHLNVAGRNGQFRTPRHIIRMMVQMVDPRPMERIGDLAAGTCGFLVNAYQHILERNTSPDILQYDEEGWPHGLMGDLLAKEADEFLHNGALRGFDNDSGMAMLRIGSMNMMLHGVANPRYFYADTLSKSYEETADYDVILMNPPFKGAVDKSDVNETLPSNTTKSELLFLHLILRALDMGGRCAVIVPDGVLFGSSRAHVEIRRTFIEENQLQGIVSMPGGVFKPYAGVSTAALIFTKGGATDRIWFYDMAHDGFSLDDKRQPVPENDIPDILEDWRHRFDAAYQAEQATQTERLKARLKPLHAERLRLEGEINRLQFEQVIAEDGDEEAAAALEAVKAELEALQTQIAPLKADLDQLGRQFWVTKEQVKANKYDLSASRYREVEQDEAFYESPHMTLERLGLLQDTITNQIRALQDMLK